VTPLANPLYMMAGVTVLFTDGESYKFAKKSGMRYWDVADTSLSATDIN